MSALKGGGAYAFMQALKGGVKEEGETRFLFLRVRIFQPKGQSHGNKTDKNMKNFPETEQNNLLTEEENLS